MDIIKVKTFSLVTLLCMLSACLPNEEFETASQEARLSPGEKLTLSHTTNPTFISAEFNYLGKIYDVSDFPILFLPNDPTSNRQYARQIDEATGDEFDFTGSPVVWAEGNDYRTVIAYENLNDNSRYIETYTFNSLGEKTSPVIQLANSFEGYRIFSAPTANSEIALLQKNALDELTVTMYNTDGTVSVSPTVINGENFDDEGTPMMVDTMGHLITCTFSSSNQGSTSNDTVELTYYSADLTNPETITLADLSAGSEDTDTCHLGLLPNGNLLVVHEILSDSNAKSIAVSLVDDTKTVIKSNIITETYAYNTSVAIAKNGHSLIVYELGGPDASGFIVLDQNAEWLSPPEILNQNEPTELLATTLKDGSFAAIHIDDDSLVATMHLISNNGTIEPEEDFISPMAPVGYGKPLAFPLTNDSFMFFYASYQEKNGYQMLEVFKNRLTVDRDSATRTNITNRSLHTVDVKLSIISL